MQVHEVEEVLYCSQGIRVAGNVAGSLSEAEVDVLCPVVHPCLLVNVIGDVRVIPRHIEACQGHVVVCTLHHQHVAGGVFVEAEGRFVALAGAKGHQVAELIAAVGLIPYKEQERFLEHRDTGIRERVELSRSAHVAVADHLLEDIGERLGESQLMGLHRGGEVDLAHQFRSSIFICLDDIARTGLPFRVALIIEQLGIVGGLVLLVPPVIRHGRGTLSLVVKVCQGAAVFLIIRHVDLDTDSVLGIVFHTLVQQRSPVADDIVLAQALVPVDAATVIQDIVGSLKGDLLGRGGHRGLVVLHDSRRAERRAVAAHTMDIDIAGGVADDHYRILRREAVVRVIGKFPLETSIEVHAQDVRCAFSAILGGDGQVETLTFSPCQILVRLGVLVRGQQHGA